METSPDLGKKIMIMTICLILIFLQELFSKENCIRKVLEEETRELTASKSQTGVNQLTFVTYKYIDPMVGLEAFRLLIPKGWQVEGDITWSANPALPAQSQFRFFNPSGGEQLELFPTQAYFWTDNQVTLSTNPPGTLRFGTLVAQSVDLQSAFNNIIIPLFRGNLSGLQYIERNRVPELEQLAKGQPTAGVNASAEGGKIRITYPENGKQREEEIYAVVSQFVTYLPGSYLTPSYFINYWYIDYIFSFKAEKGKLDSNSKIFQTMIFSFKINPQWFAKVVNTKEQMVQMIMQGIRAIGRIGDIIARTGSEMRADQQSDWERRQQANDRIVQNFCDNIRGVQRYNDPFSGNEVELPSGYGHAWANNLGEYIITDSPSYNPNVASNLNWQQIEPVP
jgi:hypothetical protein